MELLGYNDDPATRDLLLRLLAEMEIWGRLDGHDGRTAALGPRVDRAGLRGASERHRERCP